MYNLTDQPWVRVLYRDGRPDMISLSTALKDADKLHLAYSNPMDRFAVFRFLLALGYWCFANTDEAPRPGQSLPPQWAEWLLDNRQYFELFGEGPRFFQGDPTSRIRPVTDLIHELPTANNLNHLNHVFDYISGLCESCCISGLLRLPLFTTIGGAGIGAGINAAPPFYAVWMGESVAGMIGRNWEPRQNMGTAAWLDPFADGKEPEVGLLAGMTWLPRKVHLHEPVASKAACCLCGAKPGALVHSCSIEPVPVPEGVVWKDPHAVCRDSDKSLSSKIEVMSKDGYTFADRDWYTPLGRYFNTGRTSREGSLWLVGFTTNKAKRIDIWDKTLKLTRPADDAEILAQLGNRAYSLNVMRKKPRRGNYRKSVGLTLVADIMPHVEGVLAARAGEAAENRGYGWKDADEQYRYWMQQVARCMEPGITVEAAMKRWQYLARKPWPSIPKERKQSEEENESEHG